MRELPLSPTRVATSRPGMRLLISPHPLPVVFGEDTGQCPHSASLDSAESQPAGQSGRDRTFGLLRPRQADYRFPTL